MDRAIKHINHFYPLVLKENEHIFFRLRCRKFIEMVRHEAELNLTGGDKRSNIHLLDMEIDDMDMEDSMDGTDGERQDLAHEALAYGQALYAEYANDPRNEIRDVLQDVFSLMAYAIPLKEKEVAHLLDRKERVAVAEELNSAILGELQRKRRRGGVLALAWSNLCSGSRSPREINSRGVRKGLRPDDGSHRGSPAGRRPGVVHHHPEHHR